VVETRRVRLNRGSKSASIAVTSMIQVWQADQFDQGEGVTQETKRLTCGLEEKNQGSTRRASKGVAVSEDSRTGQLVLRPQRHTEAGTYQRFHHVHAVG
jgi:hypothetical protein